MNNSSWLLQLRRHLPAQDWPWVTQALRQDINIWRNLVSSPLGQFAIAALPTDGSSWSPAQLALFDNPDLFPLSQWQAESWSKLDDNGALEAKDSFIAMQEDKDISSFLLTGWLPCTCARSAALRVVGNFCSMKSTIHLSTLITGRQFALACLE